MCGPIPAQMVKTEDKAIVSADGESGGGGVSLGKGAWDCDNNCEIPPEKEVCGSEIYALI